MTSRSGAGHGSEAGSANKAGRKQMGLGQPANKGADAKADTLCKDERMENEAYLRKIQET